MDHRSRNSGVFPLRKKKETVQGIHLRKRNVDMRGRNGGVIIKILSYLCLSCGMRGDIGMEVEEMN